MQMLALYLWKPCASLFNSSLQMTALISLTQVFMDFETKTPLKAKTVSPQRNTTVVANQKRQCRKPEQELRKTKLQIDQNIFKENLWVYRSRQSHFSNIIDKNINNTLLRQLSWYCQIIVQLLSQLIKILLNRLENWALGNGPQTVKHVPRMQGLFCLCGHLQIRETVMPYEVPQGCILGPSLFNVYLIFLGHNQWSHCVFAFK